MYSKDMDMFYEPESAEATSPQIRILAEAAPAPQRSDTVGTIIDWFPRSNFLPAGTGIIRGNGLRFTFTERDVVSGDPSLVGHKVLFKGYKGFPGTATKVKVIVDSPEPSSIPELEPQPQPQLPEPEPQPEPLPPVRPVGQSEEMFGVVLFWGDESREGFIEADGVRYKFSASDVIRGIPEAGSMAKFRAVAAPDGALPHAVDVELA